MSLTGNNYNNDNSILDKLSFCSKKKLDQGYKMACYYQVIMLLVIGIISTLCIYFFSPETKWWLLPFVPTALLITYVNMALIKANFRLK